MSEALPIVHLARQRATAWSLSGQHTGRTGLRLSDFFARAPRWHGLDAKGGQHFLPGAASTSTLGYEHNLAVPAIRLWNETEHIEM